MSITNYAELQTALQNWLQRQDINALLPDFITLFEAEANRRLRVRQQQTTTPLTPSSGSVALPTDYLAWLRLTWTGNPRRELDYVEASWLQSAYPDNPIDLPSVFTIEGANIIQRPIDGTATAMEFVYYAKVPALSSGPNWLMTAHPDLYLFGTLAEAGGYTVDEAKLGYWMTRREQLFEEIITLNNRTRGPSAVRVMSPTP